MAPRPGAKGGGQEMLAGAKRTQVLALTRKFAASADVQDQALALYVNSQVGKQQLLLPCNATSAAWQCNARQGVRQPS